MDRAVQCPACLYCHMPNDDHNQKSCLTPLSKMREASRVNLQHWEDRCAKAQAWWEKQAQVQYAGFPNPNPPARSYDVAWAELLRAELGEDDELMAEELEHYDEQELGGEA